MPDHEELVPVDHRIPERNALRVDSVLEFETESSNPFYYLRGYWDILLKRRWTILTVALILTTLAAIVSFKMKPVYEATARVEVEAETPQIQSLNDLYRTIPSDDYFLQTQVKVLESDSLAWRTIQQLGLGQNPEFATSAKSNSTQIQSSQAAQSVLIRAFRDRRRVEQVRDSRMLEITFESKDPNLAARVANALVNNYTEYNFRKKYDATRQVSGWMEQQLDELKAKVETSQKAMVDYERQNAIVNISDKQNVVEQRLADLSRDLTNAQSDRMQKESLYDLVKSNESQVALIAQNDLLQRLEEKSADLKAGYVDALGQYGPNFPKVVRLRDQVGEIQSLIDRERKRIVARIRHDYMAALGREKLLSEALTRQKAELGSLNQLLIQHNILKREFETNQQLYENLLRRLKDATVSAGLRATNIHVVDSASPSTIPVRPKKLRNMMIGLVMGLILGVAFAFVEEALDNSVKSAEEVERLVGTPALAVIPLANSLVSRKPRLLTSRNKTAARNGTLELAVLKEPASALAESYRALRTAVLLSTAPHPPQALLVTSAQPDEGKSSTSLNLALALAQRGGRVLIVDADLRRSGIAPALGLSNEKGLSSYLAGAHTLDEVLYQFDKVPNLWVLPAGPHPPNPADLLSSPTMDRLLQELRQRFESLVLDSPPLLLVTDATILSTLVDGVVLVVEHGVTARSAIVRAHKILENAGGKILGAVLNKTDLRHDGYYASYYRRYYQPYSG